MRKEGLENRSPLDSFRNEMHGWVRREQERKADWEGRGRKGEAYDPHSDNINPEDLNEDDRRIWERHKHETLTREDIDQHRKTIQHLTREDSRMNFFAMIVNKAHKYIFKSEKNMRRPSNSK